MPSLYLSSVLLACGHSKRFGSNKLLVPFQGRPLCETIFRRHPLELFQQNLVVTRYPEVALSACQYGFSVVENLEATDDIAQSIRSAMESLDAKASGCLFSVCDQPLLRIQSIQRVVHTFLKHPQAIVALGWRGQRGNPVCFPRDLFEELFHLPPQQGGGWVVQAHPERLILVEADSGEELADADNPKDLEKLESMV